MPKDRIGPFARRYFSMSLRFWNSESFLPFLVFCHTFSILFIPFVFDLHLFFPFLLSLQEFMLKCECPVQIMWLIWLYDDTSVLFGFHAFHIHGIRKAAPVVPTKLTARARKVVHSCPSRKPSSLWRQNEVAFSTKFCLGPSSKVHNLLCTLEA